MFFRCLIQILVFLVAAIWAEGTPPDSNISTISVFVKSPEEMRLLQEELKALQTMAGNSNPEITALIERANRVAIMNDRCSSISINDLLDTTCARFYEIELPAFENEYMDVTGEVRLGSMRMATTLEERVRQLSSCSEALISIVVSRERLLRIRGDVYLEPIDFDGNFDVEYKFALSYDPAKLAQQQRLANLWIEKCGDVVLRQSGREFAPMFVATLKVKNDSLKKEGSNVKIMMNKKNLSLRVDMRRSVEGAYYLNGDRLFEKIIDADKKFSHLSFDVMNKRAEINEPRDGIIQRFQGKKVFKKVKKKEMVGRWIWDVDEQSKTTNSDFQEEQINSLDESEKMTTEDSLVYRRGLADLERAMAEEHESLVARKSAKDAVNANQEGNRRKIHWIPLIISGVALVGGTVLAVVSDRKAKEERDYYIDVIDINPSAVDAEYQNSRDAVVSHQKMRNAGIGIAILGGVGVVLSFVF